MLDIKYIRDNAENIKTSIKNKHIKLDLDELLKLDEKRRKLLAQADNLRAHRNELAAQAKNGKPSPENIEAGKNIKLEIARSEGELTELTKKYDELMVKVPTIPSPDTPVGKDSSENIEIYRWGEPTKFDFSPKDYIELATKLDLIDFERGTKVSGYRGYYLKNDAVTLVMGFLMYALEKLIARGFTPVIPPTLVRDFVLFGSGYFANREYDPAQDEIYKIANDEILSDGSRNKENKFLIGTAEPALLAYYADEMIDKSKLPLKFCGFSWCYRSEIGSYGKDTKGIYRVHEFMKVEQVCLTEANLEEAEKMHQEMIAISKEMHQELGLPYRVIQICTGDMSPGKYKMYDLEAWIPSRNDFGETGSASNFLDWQSRRLNVQYKDENGLKKYVYMLNNTALASPRTLIAIIENYQQADGSILLPEVLRKFFSGRKSISSKRTSD